MTNRENVLRALKRGNPERIPFEFVLCPSHIEEFKKKTGTEDYQEYFGFPFRYVSLNETKERTDFSKYYDDLPENATPIHWNAEWGVMGIPGSVAHFQEMLHPMAKFQTVEETQQYPFPDFAEDYRWNGVPEQVQEMIKNDLIAVAFMQMTIFEVAWYLRGMDNFMVDLMTNVPFAETLLETITEIRIKMAERYAQCGADILMLGDDIAMQEDMMMSPELWRQFFKPRLEKVIRAAKNVKPDILIFYHTDGNPEKVVPDLIEIGINILNPVQPECIDLFQLKKIYGDMLSFWGALGTQTTLPFGTPREVKETCKQLIEKVGKGGGLLLAPTHVIEPEVPWENVEAFLEAVQEYGKY